jgi:hypothetical protein
VSGMVHLSAYPVPGSTVEVGEDTSIQKPGMQINGKISPIRAPVYFLIVIRYVKKPVKPSFSVRVENTLNYRSVCQNKADFNLAQCLLMALQPRLFLPCIITK